MTYGRIFRAAAMGALVLQGVAFAGDESIKVYNRLRLMYDDNVYERDAEKTESWIVAEEPEVLLDMNFTRTYLGLRYRPSFVYWENRDPDDNDINQDLNLDLMHTFTPRLSLALKDLFRMAQQPEEIDRGTTIRQQEDYTYNVADGVLSYVMLPNTRVEAAGRYTLLRYDEDLAAEQDDYDIYSGGLSVRQAISPTFTVSGEYRIEDTSYTDADDRSSLGQFVGVALDRTFSPTLVGTMRAGYQYKEFEADSIDSRSSPYVDGQVTFEITPVTRMSAGAGYSLTEAGVYPYANQDRVTVFASLAHDFSAALSAYVAATYAYGDYSGDETYIEGDYPDGSETYGQFSARVSYKVWRRNWIEAGWAYSSLDSDLREDFDRNRLEIGWRTEI